VSQRLARQIETTLLVNDFEEQARRAEIAAVRSADFGEELVRNVFRALRAQQERERPPRRPVRMVRRASGRAPRRPRTRRSSTATTSRASPGDDGPAHRGLTHIGEILRSLLERQRDVALTSEACADGARDAGVRPEEAPHG
jgi:hypothetical protein